MCTFALYRRAKGAAFAQEGEIHLWGPGGVNRPAYPTRTRQVALNPANALSVPSVVESGCLLGRAGRFQAGVP